MGRAEVGVPTFLLFDAFGTERDRLLMNNELLTVLSYLERERGINRETLIEAIEFALQSAAKKSMGTSRDVRVVVDRRTCEITTYQTLIVSDDVRGADFISLRKAREFKPDVQVGDAIEIKARPKDFGRIAAQAAKQAVTQKIRQAERDIVFEEYKDRVGDIVSGAIKAVQHGEYIVDLGRAEALIPSRERVPSEDYQVGDGIRAYVLRVQNATAGPGVVLSRAAPEFVKALFFIEVAEIADGIVEVMGVARDPGFRTKIAVRTLDEKVDPVGACVGMRGSRVKNIVRELNGEKIDIVRWHEDIRTYATNALSPAHLRELWVDEADPGTLHATVDADQYSLAIGRRGQNVRLTSQLLGCRIDIRKTEVEASFEEQVANAIEALAAIENIGVDLAQTLVENGFLTVEGIQALTLEEFVEASGLDQETAVRVWNATVVHADDEPGMPQEDDAAG